MIPLAAAVKRSRPRTKSVTFREIVPTSVQSNSLTAIYLEVVRYWRDQSESILRGYDPPAITVDSPPEIESALAQAQTGANALLASLTPRIRDWASLFAAWHSRKWAANVATATGVSIAAFLTNAAIADDLVSSLNWNVGLVRNVSDQTRDRIANIVWAGWRARTPKRDIAKQLNEAIGLGRDRSRRIAIDQTTKLSGSLDRSRMLEAGINDWIWRSSHKVHFRPEHQARDGKEYSWSDPPTDSPGELPFCGCRAQSLLKL